MKIKLLSLLLMYIFSASCTTVFASTNMEFGSYAMEFVDDDGNIYNPASDICTTEAGLTMPFYEEQTISEFTPSVLADVSPVDSLE